jgi:bifunctional UDP-N-acetylglucosamine pyrophosphorylase / glucosamine-1-phosphate N-acetyltransferase
MRTCLAIVLAAGEGTRMLSPRPKVLHQIASQSMLAHVLDALRAAGQTRTAVVVGPDHTEVAEEARRVLPDAEIFIQTERRGTAHAVLAAKAAIARGIDDVLVVFGDTPLIRPATLGKLRAALVDGASVAALGFRPQDPTGYGRLVTAGGELIAIREQADASESERAIRICNGGLMALAGKQALAILTAIGSDNRKHEFYLTDAVSVARKMGLRASAIEVTEDEVRGINTKAQLAEADAVLQMRLRTAALEAGVTLVAPETVFLSADTKFGKDVIVEPYVVFKPGVVVEDGAIVRSFSYLDSARVGKASTLGPFARLRPGTDIGEDVHIGNFVEIKQSRIESGAKINHVTYVGDTTVGEGSNVGAGTIVCNYDGTDKHRTEIGKGAFIGSNSSLVAPVKIGEGAYVGAGSVITRDVPADSLALGRAQQVVKEGAVKRLRSIRSAGKKK